MLNRVPPPLPGSIGRAVYPADRLVTGTDRAHAPTDWAAAYAALCEDKEI